MTNKYYRQNREKILAQQKVYRAAHPLKKVWEGMLTRCGLHKGAPAKELAYYVGRGITVCEEWRHFKPFEAWCLANGWKKGLQIDRIDNNGNYCPENCHFVTPSQNSRNRRNTIKVRGVPLVEYYDAYANKEILNYRTFLRRVVTLKWPVEKALFTPVREKKPCRQDLPDDWYDQMELSAVQYYSEQFEA